MGNFTSGTTKLASSTPIQDSTSAPLQDKLKTVARKRKAQIRGAEQADPEGGEQTRRIFTKDTVETKRPMGQPGICSWTGPLE